MTTVCTWCGDERQPGRGDWGRELAGRYKARPGRFCSHKCNLAWHAWRRPKPESRALSRLRDQYPSDYQRLLTEETA